MLNEGYDLVDAKELTATVFVHVRNRQNLSLAISSFYDQVPSVTFLLMMRCCLLSVVVSVFTDVSSGVGRIVLKAFVREAKIRFHS